MKFGTGNKFRIKFMLGQQKMAKNDRRRNLKYLNRSATWYSGIY